MRTLVLYAFSNYNFSLYRCATHYGLSLLQVSHDNRNFRIHFLVTLCNLVLQNL